MQVEDESPQEEFHDEMFSQINEYMKSMKRGRKNSNPGIIENREYIIQKQKEDLASCLAQRKISKSSFMYCLQSSVSTMNQRKKREIGDDNLENHDLSSYVEVFKRSIEYDDDFENGEEEHYEDHFNHPDYQDPNYYQLDHHENEYYQLEEVVEEHHDEHEAHKALEAEAHETQAHAHEVQAHEVQAHETQAQEAQVHAKLENHVDEHTQHHDEHKDHDNGIMEMITNLPNIMNHFST